MKYASLVAVGVLAATAAGASAALLRFDFWGPFQFGLPVNSPVNAESLLALAFVLMVLLSRPAPMMHVQQALASPRALHVGFVALLAFLPFLITANAPFVHDSYAHVAKAAGQTWQTTMSYFWRPSGGDLFFRPLGYFSYWLDFKVAGYDPLKWKLGSIILHVANSCLVYVFTTRLTLNRFAGPVAALVFALHGSRAEAVSWVAARFDLLACLFVLLSLLSLEQWLRTGKARWHVAMAFTAVLAVVSKESAFCLPLLALGMIGFKPKTSVRPLVRASATLFAVCGAVFLFRLWVLRGMGGYSASTLLQVNATQTLKSLFFRQWSLLFFPLNWSTSFSIGTKIAVVIMLLALAGFVVWSKAKRELLFWAIVLIFLADMPVRHLLLMTDDLAGSRVLYLPVLGLAIFWGLLAQGCERPRIRYSLTAALLTFEIAALTHNLLTWRQVAFFSQATCRAFATGAANGNRVSFPYTDLPDTWHGVFFLRDGFPECVQWNSDHLPVRAYYSSSRTAGTPTIVAERAY